MLAVLSLGGGYFFTCPHSWSRSSRTLEEAARLHAGGDFGGGGPARHRARVADVRGAARAGRTRWPAALKGLYTLVYNKYFVDEIYDAAVVKPLVAGSRDGALEGRGRGRDRRRGERRRATRAQGIGGVLRLLQSGNIRSYATWVLLGSVLLLIVAMGLAGGLR